MTSKAALSWTAARCEDCGRCYLVLPSFRMVLYLAKRHRRISGHRRGVWHFATTDQTRRHARQLISQVL